MPRTHTSARRVAGRRADGRNHRRYHLQATGKRNDQGERNEARTSEFGQSARRSAHESATARWRASPSRSPLCVCLAACLSVSLALESVCPASGVSPRMLAPLVACLVRLTCVRLRHGAIVREWRRACRHRVPMPGWVRGRATTVSTAAEADVEWSGVGLQRKVRERATRASERQRPSERLRSMAGVCRGVCRRCRCVSAGPSVSAARHFKPNSSSKRRRRRRRTKHQTRRDNHGARESTHLDIHWLHSFLFISSFSRVVRFGWTARLFLVFVFQSATPQ